MNLGELKAECGRLLNDTNHQRWSESLLTTRLNLAQDEVVAYTDVYKIYAAASVSAGVDSTILDSATMDVNRVYLDYGDEQYPLTGMSTVELDYRYPGWYNWSDSRPQVYSYDQVTRTITFHPAPDKDIIVNMFQLVKPADLSLDTEVPFDSNVALIPYHISLVHWTVAQCWMDDGTPESLSKSMFHKTGNILKPGQYELQLKRIMDKFDGSENIQNHILWKSQGGRRGSWGTSKSYPLGYGWF